MEAIKTISVILIPLMFLFTVIIGILNKVNIYDAFLYGAKEGLKTVYNIFPPVVTLMIAIGIFRSSGFLDFLMSVSKPVTDFFNIPSDVIPMAVLRPMSGSGGLAMLSDILKNCGADSKAGVLASIICGSTETTFYTVAVYFGSVGIKDVRHTVKCALFADFVSIVAGIIVCNLMF